MATKRGWGWRWEGEGERAFEAEAPTISDEVRRRDLPRLHIKERLPATGEGCPPGRTPIPSHRSSGGVTHDVTILLERCPTWDRETRVAHLVGLEPRLRKRLEILWS